MRNPFEVFWRKEWTTPLFSIVMKFPNVHFHWSSFFFWNMQYKKKSLSILCQSLLNRTLTLGGKKGPFFPPLGIFLRGIFVQDGSTKIFLHVFEWICSSEKIFRIFNICCCWNILGQKLKNFEILAFSKNPIFHDQNFFFSKKHFWSWKIGFWEKAKISKFFNFWPKIFQQQQMLKTLKIFSELQIHSKTCKKILVDPSWIKIPLRKIPRGGGKGPFPPPES